MSMNSNIMMIVLLSIGSLSSNLNGQEIEKASNMSDVVSIIPKPNHIEKLDGDFLIDRQTTILVDEAAHPVGVYLADMLKPAMGYALPVRALYSNAYPSNAIVLVAGLDRNKLGAEGYELIVKKEGIRIQSRTAQGVFYGVQTLRQLLPPEVEGGKTAGSISWSLPGLLIIDQPRFVWRGMHLDVCRHFFDKASVKKYLDLMAMHKMNRFHWHLTEDQGWRIEIKKYPKLTTVGGWRTEKDGTRYGGYYTQEDIQEIIAYAKERYITVVPEIEMPGHAQAALAAYPEYSCMRGDIPVGTEWGPHKEVFCAGNENVYAFLKNVLKEVMLLFDSEYIHIGGDECMKDRWKECPKCQARINEFGLDDEHGLQQYFIRRIAEFLVANDRKVIGWDEILEKRSCGVGGHVDVVYSDEGIPGLPKSQISIMSWRGIIGGIKAARAGHDVVMSSGEDTYFYFSHPTFPHPAGPGGPGGDMRLERIYNFEIVPRELSPSERTHILGSQGHLWSEFAKTYEDVELLVAPRICVMAENLWSREEDKNLDDLYDRLRRFVKRLELLKINYYKDPTVWSDP